MIDKIGLFKLYQENVKERLQILEDRDFDSFHFPSPKGTICVAQWRTSSSWCFGWRELKGTGGSQGAHCKNCAKLFASTPSWLPPYWHCLSQIQWHQPSIDGQCSVMDLPVSETFDERSIYFPNWPSVKSPMPLLYISSFVTWSKSDSEQWTIQQD